MRRPRRGDGNRSQRGGEIIEEDWEVDGSGAATGILQVMVAFIGNGPEKYHIKRRLEMGFRSGNITDRHEVMLKTLGVNQFRLAAV